jgi:cell division protein FtsZ
MAKTSYVPSPAKIKVIGLGGAGCNAVTRMVRENIRGVEFIAMNTDAQHLEITEAPVRIQLGERCTRGLGAGGDQKVGAKAAEESREELKQCISGADMIFITAGMGGGSGTGAAPIVADIAKSSGALTIAVVTKPFTFEGTHRMQVAEEGITGLMNKVDTLIIVPNDRLLELCDNKTGVDSAFKAADEILCNAVQAIAEVITVPGMINLDYADVRTIMKDAGPAWMSIGHGSGSNRAETAAKEALNSPLLDVSIEGATGVLFNVTGGTTLSLFEVQSAASVIRQAVDPEANIIFGVKLDPNMGNDVKLTLIATGFATKESLVGSARDKEMTKILMQTRKSEEELSVPSFMRQPKVIFGRRQATPTAKPTAPAYKFPAR